jgi:hypothetical protein
MNYDYDEKIIKDALRTIETPDFDILSNVKSKMQTRKEKKHAKKRIVIPIAACLIFALSVSVFASIPGLTNLLPFINNNMLSFFRPVQISCEDNGIKMEVIGTVNDDEMALIYVTMQDLTGDRIDETLDIYNYFLKGAHAFTSEVVNYDETTKTATIKVQANGGEKLNGKRVSFEITSFLSDKQVFDNVDTGIDLLKIKEIAKSEVNTIDPDGFGSGGTIFNELNQNKINILKPGELKIHLPEIDFMYISNIGYIDGRLHIQTKWSKDNINDHGYFYFDNISDKKISSGNIYYSVTKSGTAKNGRDYVEYIFDVQNLDLENAKLKGHFITNGNYVTGNWKVSFEMQSVNEEKSFPCSIDLDSLQIDNISISPLGVTLTGTLKGNENKDAAVENIDVAVNFNDGSVRKFNSVISRRENDKIKIKFTSDLPLYVSTAESIDINGTRVELK